MPGSRCNASRPRRFARSPARSRRHDDAEDSRNAPAARPRADRSEEHTSELQSLMRTSYAVFCLKKKNTYNTIIHYNTTTTYTNQKHSGNTTHNHPTRATK